MIGLGLILVGFLYFQKNSGRLPAHLPLSLDPLPVHHDPLLLHYENTPVSIHRPSFLQFSLCPKAQLEEPIITIITVTRNPRLKEFTETVISLKGQSVQNWRWIIIDDGTDSAVSRGLLDEFNRDPRVKVIRNNGKKGVASARNLGLDFVLKESWVSSYVVMLDDDDLFELTALEKVIWMLESNRNWSLGGFPFVKFGAENITEWRGLHSGQDNYFTVSNISIPIPFAHENSLLGKLYSEYCHHSNERFDFISMSI